MFPARVVKIKIKIEKNLQPLFFFFQFSDVIGIFSLHRRRNLKKKKKSFFSFRSDFSFSVGVGVGVGRLGLKFFRRNKELFLPRISEKGRKLDRHRGRYRYRISISIGIGIGISIDGFGIAPVIRLVISTLACVSRKLFNV